MTHILPHFKMGQYIILASGGDIEDEEKLQNLISISKSVLSKNLAQINTVSWLSS